MADRSNLKLNEEIERQISMWDGTIFGFEVKNMYENGVDYEVICKQLNIDYGEYERTEV